MPKTTTLLAESALEALNSLLPSPLTAEVIEDPYNKPDTHYATVEILGDVSEDGGREWSIFAYAFNSTFDQPGETLQSDIELTWWDGQQDLRLDTYISPDATDEKAGMDLATVLMRRIKEARLVAAAAREHWKNQK
jgi:hypothetical protein